MAAHILTPCGWEGGHILDSALDAIAQRTSFAQAHRWSSIIGTGANTIQDAEAGGKVRAGGGRYAYGLTANLFQGVSQSVSGVAYGGSVIWWGGWIGFGYPENIAAVTAGDDYVLFTTGPAVNPGGTKKHPGFGIQVEDLDAGNGYANPKFRFQAYLLKTDGTIDAIVVIPFGLNLPFGTGSDVNWYWVQLEITTATGAYKLYVKPDGGSETSGTGTNTDANAEYLSSWVPEFLLSGAKGQAPNCLLVFDDFCSADNASSGTRPDSTYVEIGHQPAGDITGEDDFAGIGDTVNKYRNWDDKNDLAPSTDDENTPAGVGDTQVSTIVNKKAAGSVEAVTLVFASNSAHTIRARTGGDYQEYTSPSRGYNGLKDWYGKVFDKTPDSPQATWSNALFDLLEAGVKAIDTEPVGEFYALAFGPSLERPDKTPAVPRSFVIPRHRQLNTLLRM